MLSQQCLIFWVWTERTSACWTSTGQPYHKTVNSQSELITAHSGCKLVTQSLQCSVSLMSFQLSHVYNVSNLRLMTYQPSLSLYCFPQWAIITMRQRSAILIYLISFIHSVHPARYFSKPKVLPHKTVICRCCLKNSHSNVTSSYVKLSPSICHTCLVMQAHAPGEMFSLMVNHFNNLSMLLKFYEK